MKFLKLLLVLAFLLFSTSSAYAESFGVNLDNDADLEIWTNGDDKLMEGGTGAVILTSSDTFYEVAVGTISAFLDNNVFPNNQSSDAYANNVLTYVLEGTGNVDITASEHSFDFTDATISFYLTPTSTATDSYLLAESLATGDAIATFSLTSGSGTLQTTPGETDGLDIFALDNADIDNDVFFFINSDGTLSDWADLNIVTSLFIEIWIDTKNMLITNEDDQDSLDETQAVFTELFTAVATGALDGATPDSTVDDNMFIVRTQGGGVSASIVPEPGTMFLLGLGLIGFAGIGRRRVN